jgi:choline dehydrogenase
MKLQLHKISAADRTGFTKGTGLDPFSGVSIGFFNLYPESRGSVHIASADALAPPRIIANFMATPGDEAAAIRGLRLAREIGQQAMLRPFLIEETRPGGAAQAQAKGRYHGRPVPGCDRFGHARLCGRQV